MSENLTKSQQEMLDLFQKHVNAEMEGDLETTMATMSDNPHLTNVPLVFGGVGKDGVRNFYENHLVGKFFPPDIEMNLISRTIGDSQIVEEIVLNFTHSVEIEWFLPGVAPTNKPVSVALVVIAGFKEGKISHEHIYWDQAGVLVQIGLLDPKGLPIGNADSARKILDPKLPVREFGYFSKS